MYENSFCCDGSWSLGIVKLRITQLQVEKWYVNKFQNFNETIPSGTITIVKEVGAKFVKL